MHSIGCTRVASIATIQGSTMSCHPCCAHSSRSGSVSASDAVQTPDFSQDDMAAIEGCISSYVDMIKRGRYRFVDGGPCNSRPAASTRQVRARSPQYGPVPARLTREHKRTTERVVIGSTARSDSGAAGAGPAAREPKPAAGSSRVESTPSGMWGDIASTRVEPGPPNRPGALPRPPGGGPIPF